MAEQLVCQIETVIDGDTVTVQTDSGRRVIRLEHIDAPEVGEPYWRESRQYIIDNFLEWPCTVQWDKLDRYGRVIGVLVSEEMRILNSELVKNGLAFHFKKYSTSEWYHQLEKEARAKHINLWKEPEYYQHWVERVYQKKRYFYRSGQYHEIPDYVIATYLGKLDEEQVTAAEFEEFERNTRAALIKGSGINIREIKKLLEHSK